MIWLVFAAADRAYFFVFRTSIGLRLRAVGEHPRAADTVGIDVYKMRYIAVTASGVLAAMGGAYLSIGFVHSFNENMTEGRGFIAPGGADLRQVAAVRRLRRPALPVRLLDARSPHSACRPSTRIQCGDALPGAALRPDAGRRRRRDRALDRPGRRRPSVCQAVAARPAPRSSSACWRSLAIPAGVAAARSSHGVDAARGARVAVPAPFVLGSAAISAARRARFRLERERLAASGAGASALGALLVWRGSTSRRRRARARLLRRAARALARPQPGRGAVCAIIRPCSRSGTACARPACAAAIEFAQAEQATKIRAKYLRALEDEQFERCPSQTYVKGFLRTYADYLGLDGQLYVDEYNSRFVAGDEPSRAPRRSSVAARSGATAGSRRASSSLALAASPSSRSSSIGAWQSSGGGASRRRRTPKHAGDAQRSRAAARPYLQITRVARHVVRRSCTATGPTGRHRSSTGTIEQGTRRSRSTASASGCRRRARPRTCASSSAASASTLPAASPWCSPSRRAGCTRPEPASRRDRRHGLGARARRPQRPQRALPRRSLLALGIEPARAPHRRRRAGRARGGARATGLERDLLVVSGGLGPTHDDRTVELLARAAGRPLRLDEELEAQIEARSRARRRAAAAAVRRLRAGRAQAGDAARGRDRRSGSSAPRPRSCSRSGGVRRGRRCPGRRASCSRSGRACSRPSRCGALLARATAARAARAALLRRRRSRRSRRRSRRPEATATGWR